MMFGMGDACDDVESDDKCSCMMLFMLEEVMILVKSERSEHCWVRYFYGVHELMILCMKNAVKKIGIVRLLLH
jgi:hypothetical protein